MASCEVTKTNCSIQGKRKHPDGAANDARATDADPEAECFREWLEARDRMLGHISSVSFDAAQQPVQKGQPSKASKTKKKTDVADETPELQERVRCVPPYYKDERGHVYACDFEGDTPRYLGAVVPKLKYSQEHCRIRASGIVDHKSKLSYSY